MCSSFIKNNEWYKRSKTIIPAACSTLAKSPSRLLTNYSPLCAKSAWGSHFADLDGNTWLDCEMAMGTVVWGHCCKFINDAIIEQLNKGISFSIAGDNELELADLLLKKFNHYQSIKFFKNGADAVYAAVRASRYLSGKAGVLSCEYHGWLDWSCFNYYHLSPQDCGIPVEIKQSCFYCEALKDEILYTITQYVHQLACVVLCPGTFSKEDLEEIVTECKKNNIYIIFDEVSSGVRYGKYGVTGEYDIFPDYLCLSKGLTNGLPLAICMGKSEEILIMEKLKISNAHSSENLSIAAALACEKRQQDVPIWPTWKEATEIVMNQVQDAIATYHLDGILLLTGYPGNFHVSSKNYSFYEDPFRNYLLKIFSEHHIFSKGFILLSAAHTKNEIGLIGEILCDAIYRYSYSM